MVPFPTEPSVHLIVLAGLAVGIIPLIAGHLPASDPAQHLQQFVVGYALAGVPYLWILARWRSLDDSRRTLWVLLTAAAVVRLSLLSLPPLLSEDVWRYIWDGLVQHAGFNPYTFAPNAAAVDVVANLSSAHAEVRSQIGHAQIPTIYPPAAQLTFRVTSAISATPFPIRLLLISADLLTCLGLWRWSQDRGRSPQVVALYAFAPLAIVESSVGAHIDILGVTATVWAAVYLGRSLPIRSGIALAIGVGIKLLPLIALPTLLFRRRLRAIAATACVIAALWAPYWSGGTSLSQGLQSYGHRWRANDGAFAVFNAAASTAWPNTGRPYRVGPLATRLIRGLVGQGSGPSDEIWPDEMAFAFAKALALIILGMVWLLALWRARGFEAIFVPSFAALLLVSPVVHPWYLLWLLPFAVLAIDQRQRWPWAFLIWSLTIWIAYLPRPDYLRTGNWTINSAWVWLEYAPVWIAVFYAGAQASILSLFDERSESSSSS